MKTNKSINVLWDDCLVGVLAMTPDRSVAFQYSDQWIERGISISPFSLPVSSKVYVPEKTYFDGLFGIFADSLPDNWGRLLLDRLIRAHKQAPDELTVLDRLAIVGKSGMGALTYYPEKSFSEQTGNLDLDELADACRMSIISNDMLVTSLHRLNALLSIIYNGDFKDYLDELERYEVLNPALNHLSKLQ